MCFRLSFATFKISKHINISNKFCGLKKKLEEKNHLDSVE